MTTGQPEAEGGMTTGRVALVAAALLVAQVIGFHSLRHDDAFITYRHGQNIVRGRGITFNPGQRQMASSAPGHVMLSAAVYAIAGQEHTPSVMSALGCVGWTAQAWAVLLLARMAFPALGAAFMALGIALGAAWSQRFVALETNLAAAGLLWALWAALSRRHRTAFVLAALAGWMRPDAHLVLIPVGLCCLRDLGWRAWRPAAWGAALIAPWVLLSAIYFAGALPTTIAAKAQTVAPGAYAQAVANYVGASLALGRPELQIPRLVAPGLSGVPLTLLSLGVWSAAVAGAVLWMRRQPRLWVVPLTGLLYLGAYLLLRARIGLEWHLYPVLLVLAILVLALLVEGALWLRRWPWGRVAGPILLGVILLGVTWRTARSAQAHRHAYWFGARHDVYRKLAQELKRRAQPGDVALVGEPGTLAYYSDLPMVDTGGLVHLADRDGARLAAPRWMVSVDAYPTAPCSGPPAMRVVSPPVTPHELRPRGHTRFVAVLCDRRRTLPADRRAPRVTRFRVEAPPSTRAVTLHWSAVDDQGLERIEIWRAPDRQGQPDPKGWRMVPGGTRPLSGLSALGQLRDTPPPGRWWYGVHVLDRAGNVGYEPAPELVVDHRPEPRSRQP